jgi:hypothetical protein
MEEKSNKKPTRSRPKDKSLEAYKAWVRELSGRFTTQEHEINLTEKEWIESWKEYWEARPTKR